MNSMTLTEARQVDLVDYLAALGYQPRKIRGQDYWYLSPLPGRDERTPSFKVDRRQNLWYDHGIGKGGSIIDFGLQYHGCTIPELLDKLGASFSFHRDHPGLRPSPIRAQGPGPSGPGTGAADEKKIRVLSVGPLVAPALVHYLHQRKIPLELAEVYCRQVHYELHGRQYYAIGFPNDAGGYELRNAYFKGNSAPKAITFLDKRAQEVAIFEGFFNFLSFLVLHQNQPLPPTNFLVLNSLSFFERSRPLMEKHPCINLYLDRDAAGVKRTLEVVQENGPYIDCSIRYAECKDLNQWLIQNFRRIQQETLAKKAPGTRLWQAWKRGRRI